MGKLRISTEGHYSYRTAINIKVFGKVIPIYNKPRVDKDFYEFVDVDHTQKDIKIKLSDFATMHVALGTENIAVSVDILGFTIGSKYFPVKEITEGYTIALPRLSANGCWIEKARIEFHNV